jgi:hypothetical protein
MARTFADSVSSLIDSSSRVYANATATFASLADVAQEVYTDTDLITPASTAGVLTADSSGSWPKAFFDPSKDYKVTLKTSAGATIKVISPLVRADSFLTSSSLTPYLLKAGGTMTGALNEAKGANIASAASIDLDAATGNYVHITGTTGITAITLSAGAQRWVIFDGALTLTHSSNLVLPYALGITTVANDRALFIGEGSGVTRMIAYQCQDGVPLIESFDLAIAASDETTNLTVGTAKIILYCPQTFYVTSSNLPWASLSTVQSAGSLLAVNIKTNGATIFSTTLTFDNSEATTLTAATPCVLTTSPTTFTRGNSIQVDVDTVGTAGAKGLKIYLSGYKKNR